MNANINARTGSPSLVSVSIRASCSHSLTSACRILDTARTMLDIQVSTPVGPPVQRLPLNDLSTCPVYVALHCHKSCKSCRSGIHTTVSISTASHCSGLRSASHSNDAISSRSIERSQYVPRASQPRHALISHYCYSRPSSCFLSVSSLRIDRAISLSSTRALIVRHSSRGAGVRSPPSFRGLIHLICVNTAISSEPSGDVRSTVLSCSTSGSNRSNSSTRRVVSYAPYRYPRTYTYSFLISLLHLGCSSFWSFYPSVRWRCFHHLLSANTYNIQLAVAVGTRLYIYSVLT